MYKNTYNSVQGNLQCVLFPTMQNVTATNGNRRGMAMQSLQAISSGNKIPLDGTYSLGTAPRTTTSGGILGGTPDLCTIADLAELEQSNPYWNGTVN